MGEEERRSRARICRNPDLWYDHNLDFFQCDECKETRCTIHNIRQRLSKIEVSINIPRGRKNNADETGQGLQMQLQVVLGVLGGMERVEGAVRDDLYETLSSEHSMGRADVDKLIGVLMRDGTIFSPRPGYYKRTV